MSDKNACLNVKDTAIISLIQKILGYSGIEIESASNVLRVRQKHFDCSKNKQHTLLFIFILLFS